MLCTQDYSITFYIYDQFLLYLRWAFTAVLVAVFKISGSFASASGITISLAFSEVSPEYITFVTPFIPFVTTIRMASHPMAPNFLTTRICISISDIHMRTNLMNYNIHVITVLQQSMTCHGIDLYIFNICI